MQRNVEDGTQNIQMNGNDFIPVLLESLILNPVNDLEIFAKSGKHFFLIKPRGIGMAQAKIERYRGQFTYLYIQSKDQNQYAQSTRQMISSVIKDTKVPLRQKAALLTDCAVGLLGELFQDPSNPKAMESSKRLCQEVFLFIGQDQHAFLHLVELSSHDIYTYSHSIGVAAYSIALAKVSGLYGADKIVDLGMGALFHDIGKIMVDPSIINKVGPLNPEEWAVMKKHPLYGQEILKHHKGLSHIIPEIALLHHETLDGAGYPYRKTAADLFSPVRIVTLADAFSALTTKRSYSSPKDIMTAFLLLKENINKKFDPALFTQFIRLFLDPNKSTNDVRPLT